MPSQNPKIVLASESSSRKQILATILGYPFITHPTNIDESLHPNEDAQTATMRLAAAKLKAAATNEAFNDHFIIAADTIGVVQNRLLNKTDDINLARQILRMLSGRRHMLLTAVWVRNPAGQMKGKLVKSKIKLKPLSENEIEQYLETREWQGKAGCYSIFGIAQKFFISITGSPSAVMGLPAYETINLLKGLGLK
ncbi:MAG: septum formation protein Maf [Alphaproteobacteria bacterium]|nr:septum formation protein Maf [Alphaproteobacteria bacterium]OJV46615.1 MAG: septum formation protein Maf [Alphaproteobacteria bacterium 43-37]